MADVSIDLGVDAGNSSSVIQGIGGKLGDLASSSDIASQGLEDVGVSVDDLTNFMDIGQRRADDLARAQNAVEQSSLDMEQATRDAAQAQLDINQAQRDGVQAGIDLEQALLDQKTAQKEYNEVVKEHGKNSLEAQQAAIDLKQADEDVRQAKEDAKQATEDLSQAQLDGKQAALDGKEAQLDLNQAQRDVVPATVMNSWVGTAADIGGALLGLVGVFSVLQGGMLATAASSVGAALTTVGSWIAMAATSIASAAVVAAAWLLSIWPIALIIAAVVALVALIIIYWDDIKNAIAAAWEWLMRNVFSPIGRFFTETIPRWVGMARDAMIAMFVAVMNRVKSVVDWITNKWNQLISFFASIPGRIAAGARGMWNFITAGLRGAMNSAISIVNRGISFINSRLVANANRLPGINIPYIPYIPYLADGGITTGPTMAMIGEGREQEAVLPLSKLQGLIDMNRGGAAETRVVIDVQGGDDAFTEFFRTLVRNKGGSSVNRLAGLPQSAR